MADQVIVLIKPDGVRRGLTGEVLRRFENAELKVVALKMVWVKNTLLGKHYNSNKAYVTSLGEKTLATYKHYGKDPNKDLGTKDPYKIGQMVRKWLLDSMGSGPVVAILLGGRHAVEKARKVAGVTMPIDAPLGTIRGDLASDSAAYANFEKRAVNNIIHVSGTDEEAQFEKKLWFRSNEIHEY